MTQNPTRRLADYSSPNFYTTHIRLHFNLGANLSDSVRVEGTLTLEKRKSGDLVLDLGEEVSLQAIALDGKVLDETLCKREGGHLTIQESAFEGKDTFQITSQVTLEPEKNTTLEGLYVSGHILCTQCEASGFRHIIPSQDRPDVLSAYTVSIDADKATFPLLLAGGNLVESKDLENGRHEVTWEDKAPKSTYLFALVAGDLAVREDHFTTMNGREVTLSLYTDKGYEDSTAFSLSMLKRAMTWDEQYYGREYDLDSYKIVAVDSFNFGAMENKGLNVFATPYILAHPRRTTDNELTRLDRVIAHEYFHNWTGNRVTCRDWFQICLKEGLTVFREKSYFETFNDPEMGRLENVIDLRSRQFSEDDSPISHPPRPSEYETLDNLYTATVYEKGGEIYRMIHLVLGEEGFRKGMDCYFERYDGKAVTIEDILSALEEGSGKSLTGFLGWFTQAGTPRLLVEEHFDSDTGIYTLTLTQKAPSNHPDNPPLPIPVRLSLLDNSGEQVAIGSHGEKEVVLLIQDENPSSFAVPGFTQKPTPSILRGLSAPVRYQFHYDSDSLVALACYDNDGVTRYDAFLRLCDRAFFDIEDQDKACLLLERVVTNVLIQSLVHLEKGITKGGAINATLLALPTVETLIQNHESPCDVAFVIKRHDFFQRRMAILFEEKWRALFEKAQSIVPTPSPKVIEKEGFSNAFKDSRALARVAVTMLARVKNTYTTVLAGLQEKADNMGDEVGVFSARALFQGDVERESALSLFLGRWGAHKTALRRYFYTAAHSSRSLSELEALMKEEGFDDFRVPFLVTALFMGLQNNHALFHQKDGSGYQFLARYALQLDKQNPSLATRLARILCDHARYSGAHGKAMKEALTKIAQNATSPHVLEVAKKGIA